MAVASSLTEDIADLARFGADGPGVTRFAWSQELLAAHAWLVDRLEELDLAADTDAAGNVVGRWHAGVGDAVVVGSHLDTVPRGGRYDGALGVLSGLDALRRLKAEDLTPSRPVWLVSFTDEEGARFGTALLGSRAFAGDDLQELGDRLDATGTTLRDAMAEAGFSFERLPEARAIDRVGAYVELHIEQGTTLEAAGADIGVVTGLAGILGMRATFLGRADHAGTTPMDARHDALAGAARAILELRDHARSHAGLLRMTVGIIEAQPGGFNIVPGTCEISIDVRAGLREDQDAAREWIAALVGDIARDEGLDVELRETHSQPPHAFDERVVGAVRHAADAEGARTVDIVSGAGHDAMVVGRHVPAGMLFVPSRDGLSHTPDEYTTPEQCDTGARVLARVIAELAEAR